MSEELGREPTDEELAEEIGISSAKLSQLKTVSIRPASLDAPISDDDSTAFGESSVMKRRKRRLSCSETGTCATNLASFWGVGRPRAEDYLPAIRVGRWQTETLEEVGKKFG